MMYYKDRVHFDTIRWDMVFENATEFEDKLSALTDLDLTALMPFDALYYTLALKYVGAHTRYTDEFSFIMALIRELKIVWPIYKLQKSLMDDMMGLEVAEIQKGLMTIRNLIDNPNDPTNDPSETVIPDLSTQQETMLQKSNELTAIRTKYASIQKDYLANVYAALDGLFRNIVSNDDRWLFPQYI
jgi:hypothetical protein